MKLVDYSKKVLKIEQHPRESYLVLLKFRYDDTFHTALKLIVPGCTWNPEIKSWQGPKESLGLIEKIAKSYEYEVRENVKDCAESFVALEINPKLYPYQQQGVQEILSKRSFLLSYEMGLGKTPTTIEALRLAGCKTVLVVCPALVRVNWCDELDNWWPDHPLAVLVDSGKKAKRGGQRNTITITSYELAAHFLGPKFQFDAVVVDESHYIKNRKAARSKTVRKVLDNNDNSFKIHLTATPITNEPEALWHQLDSLYPKRYGGYSAFCERYCNIIHNAWTRWKPEGLREDTADELRDRLTTVSQRVTKHEVAHLLPPFILQPIRVQGTSIGSIRELTEEFSRADLHNAKNKFIARTTDEKLNSVTQWALECVNNGVTHICVLTHLRDTASKIVELLSGLGPKVVKVDGSLPPTPRIAELKRASALDSCILVCTMHSVGIGVDLTRFNNTLFAELDYTPATMIQTLGRFHRLSGSDPVTISVLVLRGTQDEIIAERLADKIGNINTVLKAGVSEGALEEAFVCSPEENLAGLQEAALNMLEGDEYL